MNTNDIAKEYRLAHWARMMQDRKERGLNIKEFCMEGGFHENVYYYWQRKLREAACEALLAQPQDKIADSEQALVPSGWAVCETVKSKIEAKPVAVEVNGYRVYVEANADMELLANVCRMLKSLC
jgi:putative transposase